MHGSCERLNRSSASIYRFDFVCICLMSVILIDGAERFLVMVSNMLNYWHFHYNIAIKMLIMKYLNARISSVARQITEKHDLCKFFRSPSH